MAFKYDRRALKRLRLARGLTLPALASRARLNVGTLLYNERGVTEPRASTLAKLANALDVTPAEFFVPKPAPPESVAA